jgi:hypothetical protein
MRLFAGENFGKHLLKIADVGDLAMDGAESGGWKEANWPLLRRRIRTIK